MIGSTLILIDFAEKASKNPGCKTQLGFCCFWDYALIKRAKMHR